MPASVDFDSRDISRLQSTNIARVDATISIFSNELINAICSVGDPAWTLVPARFYDENNGKEVCSGRFSAVFFEYFEDYLDYDESDYDLIDWSIYPQDKVTDRMRKKVGVIRKMVLREPDSGFPPCFRLLASSTRLYVSESAYNAIVNSAIEGLSLFSIGDF